MSKTARRTAYRKATPHWGTDRLIAKLARQGWGPLDGKPWKGLRKTLEALVDLLPYGSGEGQTTIEQIATTASYGMRWTRQSLYTLEEIGLLTWERGGVRYGQPVPSTFRIDKRFLCLLIEAAEEQRTAELIEWAAQTRRRLARIRTIRMVRAPRRRPSLDEAREHRFRRSGHVAVGANPSLKRGEPKALRPLGKVSSTSPVNVRAVSSETLRIERPAEYGSAREWARALAANAGGRR
ncbi:hypothetical protein [Actinomyces radicidentis]|uniref:hypothetical protein n=1 Tax=Actinomyces radicidentis TaxID=111015 RepID=UPI0028F0283F|nr:hypothetical protein [Actinomyces radicidentis]